MPQSAPRTEAAVEVVSFGCRLNIWESAVIRERALAAGQRDTIIVNTCAVTAEAERQARQAVRRLRRQRPQARLIVTGCAAQIAPERWAEMPEVDAVLGNREKLDAATWQQPELPRLQVAPATAMRQAHQHRLQTIDGHSRAFLQVQNGCDHRCTFCVIPLGRGPSRSLPLGEVAAQLRQLQAHGYREAVLSGVDLGAWGADLPGRPTFAALLRRLFSQVRDMPRLRLSSIDPVDVDDDLIALFASEPRLMPHLHLSLQAGHDLILKRMKRRHSVADVLLLAEKLRRARADIALGADIIAGFPTEQPAMFEASLELVRRADIAWLHVFPYSPREGTPAARMPAVPAAIRRERAAALRALGRQQAEAFMRRQLGSIAEVLIELDGRGRSAHFAPVLPDRPCPARSIVRVRLERLQDGVLAGRVLDDTALPALAPVTARPTAMEIRAAT